MAGSKFVLCAAVIALVGGGKASGDIVIREAVCSPNPIPPMDTRFLYRLLASITMECDIPQFIPFSGNDSYIELIDMSVIDPGFIDPPPFWSFEIRNLSDSGLQFPDDQSIPNLVFRYNNPQAPQIDGPADLGEFLFATRSDSPIGRQSYVTRVFDSQTGDPMESQGSFVFVPAPGGAVLGLAALAVVARRRRK